MCFEPLTRIDSTVSQVHHSETFDVTFTDGDGDIVNTSLNFHMDPESANVITAQSGNIVGTDSDDVIYGSEGDDVISGEGGSDIIHADKGDDTIIFDADDDHIDGGEGTDTLVLSHTVLDFSKIADGTIENIERLDLNASTPQKIDLTLDDVLDMTG